MPCGKLGVTSFNKSRTRDHIGLVSITSSCNLICTTEIFGRDTEVIKSISGNFRNFCSIFSVINTSIRSALAPGNWVIAVAIRLVIWGSSVRGKVEIAAKPDTTNKAIINDINRPFLTNERIIIVAPHCGRFGSVVLF